MVHRIGEDTHCIKVGAGQFRERHGDLLRAREPDVCGKHVSLDYTAHEADSDVDYLGGSRCMVKMRPKLPPQGTAKKNGGLKHKNQKPL